MAQADYVISPNPTGLAMRTEVNQIFQAILTNNAGSVAPSTVVAGMFWGDTSNTSTYYLKIRDHTNNSWVSLYAYDVATKTIQPMSNGSTLASLLALKANLASPTFTGTVVLPSTTSIGNVSNTEISYLDGVTSAIQTQLGTKAPLASPTFTGTVVLPSTTSIGTVSNTELSYLDGVTSAIQTQLGTKAPLASPALTGTPTAPTATAGTNNTQLATTAFVKAEIIKEVPMTKVSKLVASTMFSSNAVLTDKNEIIVWGQNHGWSSSSFGRGQPLGDASYILPAPIPTPVGETGTIVDCAGYAHGGYILYSTGNLYTSGANPGGGLGTGDTVARGMMTLVATGVVEVAKPESISYDHNSHRLFIKKTDNYWYATGYNGQGAIGDGTTTQRNSFTKIESLGTAVRKLWNLGGTYGCTFAQKTDGSLWAWGYNGYGQLGNGNTTNQSSPINVSSNWGVSATDVVKHITGGLGYVDGEGHAESCIAMLIFAQGATSGRVRTCGANNWGSLGDGTTTNSSTPKTPSNVPNTITKLSCSGGGPLSCFALTSAGALWAWGYNTFGQLGDGTTTNRSTPLNVSVGGSVVADIFSVSNSYNYNYRTSTFAIDANNILYATGYNTDGQLGDGTTTQRNSFVKIPFDKNLYGNIINIAGNGYNAGYYYTFLTSKGLLFGTGYNGRQGLSMYGNNNAVISTLTPLLN